MTRVASLTAAVVGWFASVLILSEALGHDAFAAGHATYALGSGAALAIWSLVAVVSVETVRTRAQLDRLAALAVTASAALFVVLAFDAVA